MADPFARVIGHDRVKQVLLKMMAHDSVPHAGLFVGPVHTGRETFVRALMQALLSGPFTEAHPDVHVVSRLVDEKTGKRKSVIGVEQIRSIRAALGNSAISGGKMLVYIDEADRLHPAAANALLKTLEEPHANTHVFLRAGSVDAVMRTIASRCQLFRFGSVPVSEIATTLKKRGLTGEDARAAADQSLGRPGRAIAFVEQSEFRAQVETAGHALERLRRANIAERLREVQELLPSSETDRRRALETLLRHWESALHSSRAQWAQPKWLSAMQTLLETRSAVSKNVNPHLALEHFLLSL